MTGTPPRLHPLHVQNLNQLVLLRQAVLLDPVIACYEYGVDKKSAECYRAATDEELLQFAYSVDLSLFVPRFLGDELCSILKAPVEIRGSFAAASLRGSRQGKPEKAPPSKITDARLTAKVSGRTS
jgi:hypothetical protein